MEEKQLDVNEILAAMREIIAEQAQQIAILRATISAMNAETNKVE